MWEIICPTKSESHILPPNNMNIPDEDQRERNPRITNIKMKTIDIK